MPEIVLECKPDETLMRTLGFTRKMITHQPSKGEVINYLKKNPNAIGVVDEDPGSSAPTYLSKFEKIAEDKYMISCLQIPKVGTRLVIIKPRLEEWILRLALESEVNLNNHAMPSTGHQLHKIINTRLPRFENMINEMIEKNNEALLYLKRVITSR